MTTAVAATPTPPTVATKPQVKPEVLQDILYEILANGLDPCENHVTAGQIEQFLFEHARAPKPPEAFVEFFKAHALSIDPDDHLKPLGIKGLPLSPPAASAPISPVTEEPSASNDNADSSETTSPKIVKATLSKPSRPMPASEPVVLPTAAPRRVEARTVWAVAAGIVILLGVGAGLGLTIANLQAEIAQAKSAQRQSQRAVTELQQRIRGLQDEVTRNAQSVERQDREIDLLVETVAPPPLALPDESAP